MEGEAEADRSGLVDGDSATERGRRGCTALDLEASRRAERRRGELFLLRSTIYDENPFMGQMRVAITHLARTESPLSCIQPH